MIINHNINAMRACRYMNIHQPLESKAMQRISSGYRINSAADDPAGLGISEGMRAQIRGLQQASKNAQDGISVIQVADGALNQTHSMLQRMREIAVKASNGTCTSEDRKSMQLEINQLTSEVNKIGTDTEFNTIKLLSSIASEFDDAPGINLQIGANSGQTMKILIQSMKAKGLNISGDSDAVATSEDGKSKGKFSKVKCEGDTGYALDISTPENAGAAISIYSDAINKVSSSRATLGAMQNVLEYRMNYLDNTADNLTAAESRIRDADMAREVMEYSKQSILYQVSQAMLVQANRQPDSIKELLKAM